jgi:3-hydroxypropanoate dehydrogenase
LSGKLASPCLDQLFRDARTHNVWLDRDVPDALLHELVDLVSSGRHRPIAAPRAFSS